MNDNRWRDSADPQKEAHDYGYCNADTCPYCKEAKPKLKYPSDDSYHDHEMGDYP